MPSHLIVSHEAGRNYSKITTELIEHLYNPESFGLIKNNVYNLDWRFSLIHTSAKSAAHPNAGLPQIEQDA